jgi:hypothetical protein
MSEYVVCPYNVTPPVIDERAKRFGFVPNMPCDTRCEVITEAPVMHFHCARGHSFFATPSDIKSTSPSSDNPETPSK